MIRAPPGFAALSYRTKIILMEEATFGTLQVGILVGPGHPPPLRLLHLLVL